MKVLIVLCLAITLAACHPGARPAQRRTVEAERDPMRLKYLAYKTKDGHIRVENLQIKRSTPKAVVSDVTFRLFTLSNPDSGEHIRCDDFNDLLTSPYFDPARPNYFITHGWTASAESDLNAIIKNAVLSVSDSNVFVVDWSGPASEFYTGARDAVPDIGLFLGDYINQMIANYGLTPSDFALSGHSLGAHISGAAGAAVNGFVSYVVGLDPAGPLFSLDDPGNRLDATDAAFVEVIHTNGGLLGFQSAIGHADYYPNGGDWQPGCGIDLTGACSHGKSYQYLGESIASSGFRATLCANYDDFESGACAGNTESMMGEYPINTAATGDYFLNTHSEPPFAMG